MDNNHNIDQQFQEYFKNRTLNPSEASWERLEIILHSEEKPKAKASIKPYFKIAAMLFFVLSATTVFYLSTQEKTTEMAANDLFYERDSQPSDESILALESSAPTSEIIKNRTSIVAENTSNFSIKKAKAVADKSPYKQGSNEENTMPNALLNSIEKQPAIVSESIDQVSTQLEVAKQTFVYIDAQKLLAEVEHNLSTRQSDHPIAIKKPLQINPELLLEQAESKASKTFLERLYKGIQDNSNSIYVSISNRNYVEK